MRKQWWWKATCWVMGVGLMTGCSAPETLLLRRPGAEAERQDGGGETFPRPQRDRTIQAGDNLTIEVLHEKELCVERRVPSSGYIHFPPLGVIEVAGKAPSEVAAFLAERLADGWFIQPHVSVEIKEYRSQTISVLGAVEKSGVIKLPSERSMDILEAIAEAGGFSRVANKNRIDLIRNGRTISVGLEQLRTGTGESKLWLQPGDIIYIHESLL